MEIRNLRYFLSAARNLNFTKAAEECHIVQSAMTQQIAALESELGVKLFTRRHKDMGLTREGEVFFWEAQRLLEGMDRAVENVKSVSEGYSQLLRLGYHGNLLRSDLPELLIRLRSQYPRLKVTLRQSKLYQGIEALKKETLDALFSIYWPALAEEEELDYCILAPSPVKLLVSVNHPLAGAGRVRMEQLRQEQFLFLDGSEVKGGLQDLAEEGFLPRIYDRVDGPESMMILVESGCAVALCVEAGCQNRGPGLVLLDIEDRREERKLCLSWKKNSPRMRPEYISLIRENYGPEGLKPQL
ncbi:MAG: LysR family transcriptional regulator [Oscillospiraceae bacterium]|nr:LysR family transcriptional regulator [Oscillospiraceae bacterium]